MTEESNEVKKEVPNDKEINFRALEAKYENQLSIERQKMQQLEERLNQMQQSSSREDDDDDDEVDYVSKKKLSKHLQRFGEQTHKQTKSEIERAVSQAVKEERKQGWLDKNKDFYDVMKHAQKLADVDPELADTILEMPDTFERQKLVYKNIKAMKLHEPEKKEISAQERINQNRAAGHYQPSSLGTPAINYGGDFSEEGQKQAYQKLQAAKKRLRF